MTVDFPIPTRLAMLGLLLAIPVVSLAQPFGVGQPPSIAPGEAPAVAPPVLAPRLEPMGGEARAAEAAPLKDCLRLQTQDGSSIIGQIDEDAKLKLRAKIGEFEISLKDVARIDRAVDENQFQVTLGNGDRLTGRLTIDDVKLEAAWGEVRLDIKTMSSLEAGTLSEVVTYVPRTSPDGRTVVTVSRKRPFFQPAISHPHDPQPTGPAVSYPHGRIYDTPYAAPPRVIYSAPVPTTTPDYQPAPSFQPVPSTPLQPSVD